MLRVSLSPCDDDLERKVFVDPEEARLVAKVGRHAPVGLRRR